MSLTMDQAVQIGQTFRTDSLWTKDSDGSHFDKPHIKQLSLSDRKVCARALDMLAHAQLNDWKSKKTGMESNVISDITTHIKADVPTVTEKKHAWYVKPFIWIAKQVHSFILGFENIFLGRVSSDKLWNKVEVYMQDYRVGKKRWKALEGSEIKKAKNTTAEKADEQKDFIKDEIELLLAVQERLLKIATTVPQKEDSKQQMLSAMDFKKMVSDQWLVDGVTKDQVKVLNYKQTIADIFKNEVNNNVKVFFEDLIEAANDNDRPEDEVRQLYTEAWKSFQEAFNGKVDDGNAHKKAVTEAFNAQKALERESELLQKKFGLSA